MSDTTMTGPVTYYYMPCPMCPASNPNYTGFQNCQGHAAPLVPAHNLLACRPGPRAGAQGGAGGDEMRDLTDVIDEMLPHIPEEHESVRMALLGIKKCLLYAAPELHRGYWFQAGAVLGWLGPVDTPWKQSVADVFADRRAEEQKS